MQSLISNIRSQFSVTGDKKVIAANKKVADSKEQITRSETRQGNATTNTTRKFAAQSKGLGGLVGVYAAAAATVFTLEAAFQALNNAAAAENIVRGTNALASAIGQSGPRILAQIKSITQGQLALAEAAELANLALASGFNTNQIEELTQVGTRAALALGRNLSDAINRVIRGSTKLEPELLDELGIFTRIDPAVRAYADSIGVASSSLTDFERRQAFVNAVIEEGNRKYASIDTSVGSTQKSLQQLGTIIRELSTGFFQTAADVLVPIADLIKNNVGAAYLAFFGILTLVFGKGLMMLKNFTAGSLNFLSKLTTGLEQWSRQLTGVSAQFTETINTFQQDINARGGLQGNAFTDPALRGTGRFNQQGVPTPVSRAAAAARTRFLAGGAMGAEREADIQALTKAMEALTKANKTNTLAFQDADRIIKLYGDDASRATMLNKGLAASSLFLSRAVNVAVTAFNYLNVALGVVSTIIASAQMISLFFGVDILGNFINNTREAAQQVVNLRQGLLGLSAVASGGSIEITEVFRRAGASDTFIENISTELDDALTEATNRAVLNVANSLPSVAGGAYVNTIFAAAEQLSADPYLEAIEREQALIELIRERQIALRTAAGQAATDLRIEIAAFDILLQQVRDFGVNLDLVAGQIGRLTGRSVESVAETIQDGVNGLIDFTQATQGSAAALSLFGINIPNIDGMIDLSGFNDESVKAVENAFLLADGIRTITESFASGETSLENYSAQVLAAEERLADLTEQATLSASLSNALSNLITLQSSGASRTAILGAQRAIDDLRARIAELATDNVTIDTTDLAQAEAALDSARESLEQFRAATVITDGITRQFSSAINSINALPFTGLLSLTGELARDSNEQLENQLDFLGQIIEATDFLARQSQAGVQLDAEQQQAVEANVAARRAVNGILVQNVQQLVEAAEAQERANRAAAAELLILTQQNDIAEANAALRRDQAIQQRDITTQENAISLQEQLLRNRELELRAIENAYEAAQALLDLERQRADIRREIVEMDRASEANAQAAYASFKLSAAQRDLETARALQDPELIREAGARILQLQISINTQEAERVLADIQRTYDDSMRVINEQSDSLNAERASLQDQLAARETIVAAEQLLSDARENLERTRIVNEENNIRAQLDILNMQEQLDLDRITAERDSNLEQLDNIRRLLDTFDILTAAVNVFQLTVEDLAEILSRVDPQSFTGIQLQSGQTDFMQQAADARTRLTTALATAELGIQLRFAQQEASIEAIADLEEEALNTRLEGLADEREALMALYDARVIGADLEAQAADAAITDRLAQIDLEMGLLEDRAVLAASIQDSENAQVFLGLLADQEGVLTSMNTEAARLLATEEERATELAQQVDILNQQLRIETLRAQSELAAAQRNARIRGMENELALSRQLLSTDEARLNLALQQARFAQELYSGRANEQYQFDDAFFAQELDRVTPYIEQAVASIVANISELGIQYDTQPLIDAATALNESFTTGAEQQQRIAEFEREANSALFAQQRAIFDEETALIRSRLVAEQQSIQAQIGILRAETALEQTKIANEQAAISARQSLVQAEFSVVQGLAAVADAFASVGQGFSNLLNSLPFLNVGEFTYEPADVAGTLSTAQDSINALISNNQTALDMLTSESQSLTETSELRIAALETQRDAVIRELMGLNELRDAQFGQLQAEQLARQEALTNSLTELNTALEDTGGGAEDAANALREQLLAIYDAIQGNLENAFMELNDLIFYGEGDFGEIMANLFRSIQTDIFQATVAEPLSTWITDSIFAAMGMPGGREGIENARVDADGALLVRDADSGGIGGIFGGERGIGNPKEEQQGFLGGLFGQTRSEMSGIFGGGGFLSQLLQSLFGQGGLFASLLRGIGNLFSNIFGGIGGGGGLFGGLFGGGGISGGLLKASGGFVHMAQGGMLGASALRRDRVPTMLEPGEFVIRRAAARNIGAGNLQAMNATGQMGGNVQVNVNNTGTPQEATASAPKFDGEKYVIDIVTRDLANNGPIRRSIRGGAL